MKKVILIAIAALFVFLVAACGADRKSDTNTTQPNAVNDEAEGTTEALSVSLIEIRKAIIDELEITEFFELETEALLDLYGIRAEAVAQSASFVTMSGTFPDEVILIEAVDETAAAEIEEMLNNRLSEVMVQSQTYDAENYAAAQKCRVWRNDLHVALILSPMQEAMAEIYNTYLK